MATLARRPEQVVAAVVPATATRRSNPSPVSDPLRRPARRRTAHIRDALRADDALRDRYQALKRRLAKEFRNDREAYTDAKADFIDNTVACRRPRG